MSRMDLEYFLGHLERAYPGVKAEVVELSQDFPFSQIAWVRATYASVVFEQKVLFRPERESDSVIANRLAKAFEECVGQIDSELGIYQPYPSTEKLYERSK